jgi:hypothetical protein
MQSQMPVGLACTPKVHLTSQYFFARLRGERSDLGICCRGPELSPPFLSRPPWVTLGNARTKHNESALSPNSRRRSDLPGGPRRAKLRHQAEFVACPFIPSRTDIGRHIWQVRFVS